MQRTLQTAAHHSPTLQINEEVARLREGGMEILNLGFGEAGLPVAAELVAAFASAAGQNRYAPTAGSLQVRQSVADFISERRNMPTTAEQIVMAPGSKALLYALLAVIPGDVVLPRPSWVSYAAQAKLLGRRVVWADIPAKYGGIPDPDKFAATLEEARSHADPRILVITLPDNPTGTIAPSDQVEQVCSIARSYGITVISDEIYRDLIYEGAAAYTGPGEYDPDVFVTSGLSKNLALGGWRTGFLRVPDTEFGTQVRAQVIALASEVWSAMPTPLEAPVSLALSDEPAVVSRIAASRRLHGAVARQAYQRLTEAGVECRPPSAGFYVYPDFSRHAATLLQRGIATSDDLAKVLLRDYGVATLPGTAFGDHAERLTLRIATSLMYGASEDERLTALSDPEPTRLPSIQRNLDWLSSALAGLLGSHS